MSHSATTHAQDWERFLRAGRIDGLSICPEIAQSWQRCLKLKVDPRAPRLPVMLDARQLAALREENALFMQAALPFMQFLKNAVKGSGFILVLTERSGVVLEVFGDEAIMAMAQENNYVAGCSRAEEVAGTNAISLALIEKKPVQLVGAEHWNVRHHHWTCASAPVFSPEGMLLGTVTLSGETINAHSHTLGMVISAAEAIGERLRERELAAHQRRADALLSSVLTSISDALVTVAADGRITNINPAARKLLALAAGDAVGKSILKLFPAHPELLAVAAGQEGPALEVVSERASGRAHFVVTPYVMHSDGEAQGAILAVRERRDFLNEVRDFAGLNAVFTFEQIIGQAPALLRQIELARVAARQSARILILGETGTGKEMFAQAIHNCSPRRTGAFVALNCAAIPRELMESELFGYRGGAFTGSRKGGQVGKLELADGGTLFLDEVHQMPLDLQAKLLRALQDGVITPLGDTKPIRIDVRVVAAANEDLYAKSRTGEFRQALYFRLSVVEISLPALRERVEDIPRLAQHLLAKLAARMGRQAPALSPAALQVMLGYAWPGNVRELENVLEMAAIVCEGCVVEPEHLAQRLRVAPERATPALIRVAPSVTGGAVREVEVDLIRTTIRDFNGNITEAARRLGLSRSTVYRRMHEHGIMKSLSII
jgi:transcriptional regulator of acetoin/glycerol metabolism